MALTFWLYFTLLHLCTIFFRASLPAAVPTFTISTGNDSGGGSPPEKFSFQDDTADVISRESFTVDLSNLDKFQGSDIENESLSELFHLFGTVDVSDMDSSGEETTGSANSSHELGGHSRKESEISLENLTVADAQLERNDVENLESQNLTLSASHSIADKRTAVNSEQAITIPGSLNMSAFNEDLNGSISTEEANFVLKSEQDDTNGLQNRTKAVADSENSHSSDFWLTESAATDSGEELMTEYFSTESTENGLDITTPIQEGTSTTDLTSEITSILESSTYLTKETVSEIQSKASESLATSETEPSTSEMSSTDSDSTVSFTQSRISTEIISVLLERTCPDSGICVLWFLSPLYERVVSTCQSDSDCSGSMCCRVRCARTCINL